MLYDILVKKSIIEEGVCIMAKILIVDDEPRIRELIREHLQYSGYICEEAADGTAALTQLSGGAFDLVILDLMMPFMDGMTCLREMRARHINTPVIILTARGEEYDKLAGLEGGADDYVVKPFSPKELMMRVAAIIKRSGGEENNRFVFEGLTVDFTARLVFIDEQRIEMSPKEYDLFFYMVRNRGVALTRERLIHDVWGYDFYGDDRTLDTHVKLLRKSLGRYSRCIITLRGVGYRFETVAEPESDADGDAN